MYKYKNIYLLRIRKGMRKMMDFGLKTTNQLDIYPESSFSSLPCKNRIRPACDHSFYPYT